MSTSSAASTSSPKITKFAAKSGFVIPKNKLSGSLVPIIRGGKKSGSNDTVNEDSIKQAQRKTKWGPDLTQDAAVRKGRALAYQARVEQITQQLKSGNLESQEDNDSVSVSHISDQQSSVHQINKEKSEQLELERREAIGEILNLNPSYKAPANYKPLLKEAKVPIPIKQYPGYNFLGLIFGAENDTHKRLEKETGAKILVYGTKADAEEKDEIIRPDGKDIQNAYDGMYINVSADTYEKVDSAVALIELLVTPVSVNPAAVSTSTAVSSDGVTTSQSVPTTHTVSTRELNQGVVQPPLGTSQPPPQAHFQPYPGPWFPTGPPRTPIFPSSGLMTSVNPPAPPIQGSSPFNPSHIPSLFGPRPVLSAGIGSFPQNANVITSRPQSSLQVLRHPHPPQIPNPGQVGPPRNHPMPFLQSRPGQPNVHIPHPFSGPLQISRPVMSSVPQSAPGGNIQRAPPFLLPPVASQSIPVTGAPPLNFSSSNNLPSLMAGGGAPNRPIAAASFTSVPQPQVGFPSFSFPQQQSSPLPSPVTSSVPGSAPNFTLLKPPSLTTPKPQHPVSSDFTFRPSSQVIPRPGNIFGQPQATTPTPPFQPPIHGPNTTNRTPSPLGRPVFRGPNPDINTGSAPQMGPRSFSIAPQMFNTLPHRPMQLQQIPGRPIRPQNMLPPTQQLNNNFYFSSGHRASRPLGMQQSYDPFSPTAAPINPQPGSIQAKVVSKQETDPEYEDLMASVGVK